MQPARKLIGFFILLLLISPIFSSCSEKSDQVSTNAKDSVASHDDLNEPVNYNFHIRPILSDKCFFCHGPDEKNNKAGFRLDTEAAAFAKLKDSDVHGIVPGEPIKSAVWQRINSDNPEKVMPPIETKRVLTDKEKRLIKRWIEQGAKYEPHWAFQNLPQETDLPKFDHAGKKWANNGIDHFVYHRLSKEQLSPSQEASPERWLRRASLDITGLPPTPSEINHFLTEVKSDEKKAYEDAADRLLASKAYGEHQAIAWLDAVRYADSYGYQTDSLNSQWPYRDWVISAFNKNLPYDQFLLWNIAGDLLENPTEEQRLATAYNRLHRLTNEGGSIREEFIVENAADRLHTFGTSTMALTMECSRCHDHKYDPISAKDYYSLMAFFNSIPENGLYDKSFKVPSPTMLLPDDTQKEALRKASADLSEAEKAHQDLVDKTDLPSNMLKNQPIIRGEIAHYTFDEDINNMINHTAGKKDKLQAGGNIQGTGKYGKSLLLDGDKGTVIKADASFDRYTPFSFSLWCKDKIQSPERVVLLQKTNGTDVGYNGYDIMLEAGHIEARLFRVWPGNGIGVRSMQPISKDKWQHITWTYDGSSQASGMQLFLDGQPMETQLIGTELLKNTSVGGFGAGHLTIGQRFRDKGFTQGEVDELRIFNRQLTELEVKMIHQPSYSPAPENKQLLTEYYRHALDKDIQASLKTLTSLRKQLVEIEKGIQEIPIMKELKQPRKTYILERGEYDSPKKEENRVQRGVFEAILPRMPDNAPKNRLGLAQWLTSPDHPLTSRVIVNRVWQGFFGQGIVSTPENFGLQGAIPSHPHLLDWLARDFVENNWNIKRLCKKIVLSSTYRQDSIPTPELLEKDPKNTLLARGPAYRLSAEQIRDLALFSSGLLDKTIGGEPVYPYQPGKDLWRESNNMSPSYRQGKGKDLHRRSIYSIWKRTSPLPNMMSFDATSREVCIVERERTNTPLQALVLLNDVQFVEASRHLASKLIEKNLNNQSEMIKEAFLRLTGRQTTPNELNILSEIHSEQLNHYQSNLADAEKLINLGDTSPPKDIDTAQLASMTIVCQAIMNLDAAIWKR